MRKYKKHIVITADNAGVKYLQGRRDYVIHQFNRYITRIEEAYAMENMDEIAQLMYDVIEVREHEMALEVLGYEAN